ncbi:MAG: ATP-binding cassette domain-containing protein [Myxococcales bacterium]|nr:ATP-binding cassette domain-containing protein [Myxococcales bacterium]
MVSSPFEELQPDLQVLGISKAGRLSGVTLALRGGRITGLVGESGSGKSTLGRIVAGLDVPDEGRILLDGLELGLARWSGAPHPVQLCPQDPRRGAEPADLDPHFPRDVARARRAPFDEILAHLDRVGLDRGLISRRPTELSGGQAQLAGWARILATEPRFLVLDESFVALDAPRVDRLAAVVRALASRGAGILVISHDLSLVRSLASDLVVLWRGRVVERGTIDRLEDPRHPHTARLVEAEPWERARPAVQEP